MPLLLVASLMVQILCVMHAIRTGRDRYWIYIIMISSFLGCLVYFLAEIAPDIYRGRIGGGLRKHILRLLDPGKDYREAKYNAETAPTVHNRLAYAQVLMQRHEYDKVIALLEPALTPHFSGDQMLLEGLAYAWFFKGDYPKALGYIKMLYDQETPPKGYIKLLRAQALEAMGDAPAARAELTAVAEHFPGEEARIALAQLCERMGAGDDAREIYRDIVERARHAPKHYLRAEKEWIATAKQALAAK